MKELTVILVLIFVVIAILVYALCCRSHYWSEIERQEQDKREIEKKGLLTTEYIREHLHFIAYVFLDLYGGWNNKDQFVVYLELGHEHGVYKFAFSEDPDNLVVGQYEKDGVTTYYDREECVEILKDAGLDPNDWNWRIRL